MLHTAGGIYVFEWAQLLEESGVPGLESHPQQPISIQEKPPLLTQKAREKWGTRIA